MSDTNNGLNRRKFMAGVAVAAAAAAVPGHAFAVGEAKPDMLSSKIQSADFKSEKHVPVISVTDKKDGVLTVSVEVGKDIPHPNTLEHYIAWIDLYFVPENGKFAHYVGRAEFSSHGEPVSAGKESGKMFSSPVGLFRVAPGVPGKLYALSYCNIHGLWESAPVAV